MFPYQNEINKHNGENRKTHRLTSGKQNKLRWNERRDPNNGSVCNDENILPRSITARCFTYTHLKLLVCLAPINCVTSASLLNSNIDSIMKIVQHIIWTHVKVSSFEHFIHITTTIIVVCWITSKIFAFIKAKALLSLTLSLFFLSSLIMLDSTCLYACVNYFEMS